MTFDIHALDRWDWDAPGAEEKVQQFQEGLLELFAASPEATAFQEQYSEGLGWASSFLDLGFNYLGLSPSCLTLSAAREILEDLFPAKISLAEPEDADSTIPELIAFWQFLKRQFQLKQSDSILKLLEQLKPQFRAMMNDSSRFGFAKSFFRMGQAAGFDMTSQTGLDAFKDLYNAAQMMQQAAPSKGFSPLPSAKKSPKKKRKK